MGYSVIQKGTRVAQVDVTGVAGDIVIPLAELFTTPQDDIADRIPAAEAEHDAWMYNNARVTITPMNDTAFTARWIYGGYSPDAGGTFTFSRNAVTAYPSTEVRVTIELPYGVNR